jgi:hypothetical protein
MRFALGPMRAGFVASADTALTRCGLREVPRRLDSRGCRRCRRRPQQPSNGSRSSSHRFGCCSWGGSFTSWSSGARVGGGDCDGGASISSGGFIAARSYVKLSKKRIETPPAGGMRPLLRTRKRCDGDAFGWSRFTYRAMLRP